MKKELPLKWIESWWSSSPQRSAAGSMAEEGPRRMRAGWAGVTAVEEAAPAVELMQCLHFRPILSLDKNFRHNVGHYKTC